MLSALPCTFHLRCVLCIPKSSELRQSDPQNLYDQLPKPSIIMSDLNGHDPIWGSANTNNKGKVIEDFLSDNNLCVFNDDLHPATGTFSALICPSQIQTFAVTLNGLYVITLVKVTTSLLS